MKQFRTLVVLLGLAGCAAPDSPAKLAAAGLANTPTNEGTMPTTASPVSLPGGAAAWSINCQTGRNYGPCEARARSVCPQGYTELSRKTEEAKNSSGIKIETVSTGQGEDVTGVSSTMGPPSRTIIVLCK